MRIIAGAHRGLRLAALGKGAPEAHLRPTSDRVREAFFNILTSGRFNDPITGMRVLDLFAGTGALGLEALSRGAAHVTFVDDGRTAQNLIQDNVKRLQAHAHTHLLRRDATRLGQCPDAPCALVFLDPPYGKNLGDRALAAACQGGWIAPNACIVWEEATPQPAPPGFTLATQRRYGDTHISVMHFNGIGQSDA